MSSVIIVRTENFDNHVSEAGEYTLRHFTGNQVNTLNNRAFAVHKGKVLEVVRRGEKNTRVRDSLDRNTDSYLVPTSELEDYYHVDRG